MIPVMMKAVARTMTATRMMKARTRKINLAVVTKMPTSLHITGDKGEDVAEATEEVEMEVTEEMEEAGVEMEEAGAEVEEVGVEAEVAGVEAEVAEVAVAVAEVAHSHKDLLALGPSARWWSIPHTHHLPPAFQTQIPSVAIPIVGLERFFTECCRE